MAERDGTGYSRVRREGADPLTLDLDCYRALQ